MELILELYVSKISGLATINIYHYYYDYDHHFTDTIFINTYTS